MVILVLRLLGLIPLYLLKHILLPKVKVAKYGLVLGIFGGDNILSFNYLGTYNYVYHGEYYRRDILQ